MISPYAVKVLSYALRDMNTIERSSLQELYFSYCGSNSSKKDKTTSQGDIEVASTLLNELSESIPTNRTLRKLKNHTSFNVIVSEASKKKLLNAIKKKNSTASSSNGGSLEEFLFFEETPEFFFLKRNAMNGSGEGKNNHNKDSSNSGGGSWWW